MGHDDVACVPHGSRYLHSPRFKIKKAKMGSESRWVNWWESLIQWVHEEIVEPNFEGKYAKKAAPYFLSLFFFILFCNYLGMLPGMSTATGNLAVTGGLAILTLVGIIGVGIVKAGAALDLQGHGAARCSFCAGHPAPLAH